MNFSHGESCIGPAGKGSPEYGAWLGILDRCYRKSGKKFPRYGGRGITVCARWRKSFSHFLADVGRRPTSKHSIDRIRVNGNYTPKNVRWATHKEQQNNRTNNRKVRFQGKYMTLSQAVDLSGLSYDLVKARLRIGWSEKDALLIPCQPGVSLKNRKKCP